MEKNNNKNIKDLTGLNKLQIWKRISKFQILKILSKKKRSQNRKFLLILIKTIVNYIKILAVTLELQKIIMKIKIN